MDNVHSRLDAYINELTVQITNDTHTGILYNIVGWCYIDINSFISVVLCVCNVLVGCKSATYISYCIGPQNSVLLVVVKTCA